MKASKTNKCQRALVLSYFLIGKNARKKYRENIQRVPEKIKKRIEGLEKKGIVKKKPAIKPETHIILAVKYFIQEVLVNAQVIG